MFDWFVRQAGPVAELFWAHLLLSVLPVTIGLALALPLGWAAQRGGIFKSAFLSAAGLIYTIPSLAMFVILPTILGTKILDPVNVVTALTLYTLALLVRTVSDGLDSVAEETLQAADALGFRPLHRLLVVELPIATPVIAANLRVAVVSNVSIVSVAALVGTPQLGTLFTQGMQEHFMTPIVAGVVLCIVLAVMLDSFVIFATRMLTPWRPKARS